jgi:hypothetical protein
LVEETPNAVAGAPASAPASDRTYSPLVEDAAVEETSTK